MIAGAVADKEGRSSCGWFDREHELSVGPYTITPTAGNLSAANYDFPALNFVNGTLTINPAHLIVTADAKSRLYGAANPLFTATIRRSPSCFASLRRCRWPAWRRSKQPLVKTMRLPWLR